MEKKTMKEKMKEVSSLFGACEFKKFNYLEYYQRNVYGNYHLNIEYQTVGGIDITKETIEEVPLEVNITNNGIYPSGYRVNFNGEGYLDGNLIISNHAVISEGKHTLLVKGANTEEQFEFFISKNQYQIDEKYQLLETTNILVNEEYIGGLKLS